eukprot:CAMPEP_0179355696 /NCGR_PEP_ID=MMETSP0797-20121207/77506_1 /TAXON_ID=47934 /ORGANISM="Dinophysis acuminata, Strain DAEP01" /LENGTH=405 /DNA_ID=CAMNT_0021070851 /DNA_START=78 /DNA_END=1292 /DNA_ORIENTATION=+
MGCASSRKPSAYEPTASKPAPERPTAPAEGLGDHAGEGCHGDAAGAGGAALAPDTLNGFDTIPEPDCICCREANIAPFTLPAEALTYEPAESTKVTVFQNGDRERKIYCNIELQQSELDSLAALQSKAKARGVRFFPSVTAMATRFLSHARNDVDKALQNMCNTQEWRQEYFKDGPVTDDSVLEDLREGIVYFTGRDHALRPLIVIRALRVPQRWYREGQVGRLIRVLVFCVEYFKRYMVVPGRVENLSVAVDLRGLQVSQIPLPALRDVYRVLSCHYAGRVFKFYACNLSPALAMIGGVVKAILTDRQKQKLQILRGVEELRQEFALHQLEEDLGGLRPTATEFLPFPLNAGPFAANSAEAPADAGAVPGAHAALTPLGAIGRLWDPRKTDAENTALEYDPEAR